MEQGGSVELNWSVGYEGSAVYYTDANAICFLNSNCLKQINLNDESIQFVVSPGDGIKTLAVNTSHGVLAFSEDGMNARIFVYEIGSFKSPCSILSGGDGLGYTCLAFANNSSILASCSNIPQIELRIWNWVDTTVLCSVALGIPLTCLTINPLNWRHVCGSNENGVTLWNIAVVNDEYHLHATKFCLPFTDGSFGRENEGYRVGGSRPSTGHGSLKLTMSAIAGLVGTGKESYNPTQEVGKFQPVMHCWGPDNQVYCSSSGNQLLLIDTETTDVKILYCPGKEVEAAHQFEFRCIQLHKEGLFAGGKNGIIRCFDVSNGMVQLKFEAAINKPISSLSLSPNYEEVVVGSELGSIHLFKIIGQNVEELLDDSSGTIVGITSLGGDTFVICRSSGLLQIGSVETSIWVAALHVNREVTCLTGSPGRVFLGTSKGSVLVIDVGATDKPKFVSEQFLHKAPVSKLKIDSSGSILISGSSDGHLFILNGTSEHVEVLGHTDISGNVLCLSVIDLQENAGKGPWKVLAGVCSSDHKPGCNQLIEMEINKALFSRSASIYMDSTMFLKDMSICKQNYLLKTFIYDIAIVSRDSAYAITHQGKKVAKLALSLYENTPTNLVIEASVTHVGHGLLGGSISMSHQGKWLATIAPDGYIMLRTESSMDNPFSMQAGNYRSGGLSQVCFSADSRNILTCTKTACISCWKIVYGVSAKRNISVAERVLKIADYEIPMEQETPVTKLEQAVMKAHKKEDEKYSDVKTKLRSDINDLRKQVLSMMAENEEVPEIEKLDRHEFNMDVEERQKLISQQEKILMAQQAQIELEDTAKQYLHHLIKKECWEEMKVKGRSIKSFNANIEVPNYPMRERSRAELDELQSCVKARTVEEIESDIRAHLLPGDLGAHNSLVERKTQMEADDDDLGENEHKTESAALYGSLGFAYGGGNTLLQSEFLLHTKAQKRNQMILLQDCIYNIKTAYNKRFDEVYNFKAQEVRRINERNTRLEKIVSDMKIEGEEFVQVGFHNSEMPETLLEVSDNEITVEKYLSEKERKILEEEASAEEERRRLENADNARERALEDMMAGRLETNLEEELKEEIEEPDFFVKAQDEWSEEEQKAAKEYEKKKVQLNEEREKYRKSLETELKKLQSANVDAMTNFDERLNQLFHRRIKTEMVILQEELKIVRLNASILADDELDARVQELLNFLEVKKEEKQASSLNVGNAKREVETFKENYESLVADDRALDKVFRKEFSELDPHSIDVLYKLFKKRPRAQRTLKAASDTVGEVDGNPFQMRPSSSRVASAAVSNLEKAMQELDGEQHMPENIYPEVWKKFVLLRRGKVEKEQILKSKALVLADMNAYLQRQIDNDEDLKFIIEKTFEDIQRLREEKLRFNLNLEVQLLLKQGQVEVGNCDFVFDYSDSLLIHRSAVEDLNVTIKTLGDAKLASMRESKDFRKGIHQLAWQLKEMFMKAEDLQSAAQDLQMLRVTKELQVYLSENDQRQSKQHEIGTLEKTLEMYKKMHQRNIQDRKRVIRNLKHQIKEKGSENETLDAQLEELALCVAERKNINDVNADHRTEAGTSKKMQDIITRRKLVDLAKAQANEIGMLRAEVERLRMRTFPALVQSGPM